MAVTEGPFRSIFEFHEEDDWASDLMNRISSTAQNWHQEVAEAEDEGNKEEAEAEEDVNEQDGEVEGEFDDNSSLPSPGIRDEDFEVEYHDILRSSTQTTHETMQAQAEMSGAYHPSTTPIGTAYAYFPPLDLSDSDVSDEDDEPNTFLAGGHAAAHVSQQAMTDASYVVHEWEQSASETAAKEATITITNSPFPATTIPLIRGEGDRECPICREEYQKGEKMVVLPCQGLHRGHLACVKAWHAVSLRCMTCREVFKGEVKVVGA